MVFLPDQDESAQESPVNHADTRPVELARLNDESGNDDGSRLKYRRELAEDHPTF